jgi:biotin carboxyl carrier protein
MLEIAVNGNNSLQVASEDGLLSVNGVAAPADIQWQPNGLISILYRNKSYTAVVEKTDIASKEIVLRIDGKRFVLTVKEEIDLLLASMGMNMSAAQKAAPLKAPMPGMVLKVLVSPGQVVNKGDGLLILEAMKMENVLKASGTATVKAIRTEEKTAVEKGAVLIEME